MGPPEREGRKRKQLGIRPPPTRPDPESNPLQETNLPPPVARPSPVLATSASSKVVGPDTQAVSWASTEPTTRDHSAEKPLSINTELGRAPEGRHPHFEGGF